VTAMRWRNGVRLGFLLVATVGRLNAGRWDSVIPLARDAVNPTMAMRGRLFRLNEAVSELTKAIPGERIVYVRAEPGGREDGSSWENAFHSVQQGIDALAGREGWVWVAQGTYRENVLVRSGVSVFGGFWGDEEDVNDRDPFACKSLLVGDSIKSVVFMEHKTLLDGFNVTRGGGGKYLAGGGVLTGDWLSVIRNNTIYGNRVEWSGGGIFVYGGGLPIAPDWDYPGFSPLIEGNVIYNNSSRCGDGVNMRYSSALFVRNTVVNHPNRGIEIICAKGEEPTIVHSILWNNKDDLYNHVTSTGTPIFLYNFIENETVGIGLVGGNPRFSDSAARDFTLRPDSPCIDAGMADAPRDPDGSLADFGARSYARHRVEGGVRVSFESVPITGMRVLVDRTMYTTPFFVSVQPGSRHLLRAVKVLPQGHAKRYDFLAWSDGGDREHDAAIGTAEREYEILYGPQFLVSVDRNGFGSQPIGEGWYNSGTSAILSADSSVQINIGTRHRFIRWAGSVVSSDPRLTLTVEAPVAERIEWKSQFRLAAACIPEGTPGLAVQENPEKIWYDRNETVRLSAVASDAAYRFVRWEGDVTGTQNPVSVTVDTFKTAKAVFEKVPVYFPPTAFALVSPPDTVLNGWTDPICFVWRTSADPDPNDTVRYTFYLSGSVDFSRDALFSRSVGRDTSLRLEALPLAGGEYYWRVKAGDVQQHETWSTRWGRLEIRPSAVGPSAALPGTWRLHPAYPNPFNGGTEIRFAAPADDRIRMNLIDTRGRIVRRLMDARVVAGNHAVRWDGRDDFGRPVPSGLYTCAAQMGHRVVCTKLVVLH